MVFMQLFFIGFCILIFLAAIEGSVLAQGLVIAAIISIFLAIIKLFSKSDVKNYKYNYNEDVEKYRRQIIKYDEQAKKYNEQIGKGNERIQKLKEQIRKDEEKAKKIEESLKKTQEKTYDYSNYHFLYDNEFDLNDESILKKLGYSLQINEKERHRILKEKAIPLLGKEKCIKHLEFQIRLKENIVTKDYSNAVSKWQSDIEYIINYDENDEVKLTE